MEVHMRRILGTFFVGLLAAGLAHAHFPFIVPDESGASAKVVFSDSLEPDPAVKIEKLDGTKLFFRESGSTKNTPLEWKKGEACYEVKLPGKGTAFGVTEYGVLQKGDAKPFRLVYYPKSVVGDAGKAIGDPLKVEIVSAVEGGKVRFQVLAAGKPATEVEATVMLPGDTKQAVKTDKDGFTPAFDKKGRYGVQARVSEAKAGEFAGKKYEEVRSYATLVTDVK
jgi:hypothetical protein